MMHLYKSRIFVNYASVYILQFIKELENIFLHTTYCHTTVVPR
jgi:hypothetical protein